MGFLSPITLLLLPVVNWNMLLQVGGSVETFIFILISNSGFHVNVSFKFPLKWRTAERQGFVSNYISRLVSLSLSPAQEKELRINKNKRRVFIMSSVTTGLDWLRLPSRMPLFKGSLVVFLFIIIGEVSGQVCGNYSCQ